MRPTLTVRGLAILIALIGGLTGFYIAGYRAGYEQALLRPPNFARDRAYLFARLNGSYRTHEQLVAVFHAARQAEETDPGFLARIPRLSTNPPPLRFTPHTHRWVVTLTNPRTRAPLTLALVLDEDLEAEFKDAEAAFRPPRW